MKKLLLTLVLSLVGPLSAAHHAAADKEADDKSKALVVVAADKAVAQSLELIEIQKGIKAKLDELCKDVDDAISPQSAMSLAEKASSIATAYQLLYVHLDKAYAAACEQAYQAIISPSGEEVPGKEEAYTLLSLNDYPEWKPIQGAMRQAAQYIAKNCSPALQDKIWQHFVVALPQTDLVVKAERVSKEAHDVLNETMLVHRIDVTRDGDVLDPLPVPVRQLVVAYLGIMKFALKDVAHILPPVTSNILSITHINDLAGLDKVDKGCPPASVLNLDYLNEINFVPNSFPYSDHFITALRMKNNGLPEFPLVLFKQFPGLRHCYLASNQIRSLSAEALLYLRQMQSLRLDLFANPLDDETKKALQEIVKESSNKKRIILPAIAALPATAAAGTAPVNNTDQKS
jgi:hypothetical protein